MADIFGVRIPQGGAKGTITVLALISIPVALVAGAGYGLYRGVQYIRGRAKFETEEEQAARLEQTYRFPPEGRR